MDFFYFRGELTLRTTFIWIGGMILFACAESAPLFFMAQISPLVSFQAEVQMQNILICREVWTKGSRVAYKTFSCVFQFIIPLCFVVSISLLTLSLFIGNLDRLNVCFLSRGSRRNKITEYVLRSEVFKPDEFEKRVKQCNVTPFTL